MFGILHADGSGEDNPPLERLSSLFDELAEADEEHGEVSVINDDNAWAMSVNRHGLVTFGRIGERNNRYLKCASKQAVLMLWARLIEGDIEGLLSEPWKPQW